MKIFYCITFLHYGGGRALLDLAKEAKRRGHQVYIAATDTFEEHFSQPALIEEAVKNGIEVSLHEDLFSRKFKSESVRALLEKGSFDLIHSHTVIPGKAASGFHLPQLSTFHGWSPDKPHWMIEQDVAFLNTLPLVHTISHHLKEYLIDKGVTSPIRMVYNGIDFSRLDALQPLPKSGRVRIGTVCGLAERKGIRFLIEAVKLLPPDIEVIIAGQGNEKPKLMEQAADVPNITILDYQEDPLPLIKSFDLFVLPSLSEGLPLTPVEAMYLEVPVITTSALGCREIALQGGAIMVPPADSTALAQAISSFLSGEAKVDLATSHLWAATQFDIRTHFDKIFALYQGLLNTEPT